MNSDVRHPIFTIGHSNLEFEKFLAPLKQHEIQAVADVRSSPYSQFNPQYNREPLRSALQNQAISYVFLGDELGARRTERECYLDGRADYSLISQTPAFRQGIDRLLRGASTMRIALLCAEKEPLECHRCILISPHLRNLGLTVSHILSDGELESHEHTERRLLHSLNFPEQDLFRSTNEMLADAYKIQGAKIAYNEEEPALHEEPPRYGN